MLLDGFGPRPAASGSAGAEADFRQFDENHDKSARRLRLGHNSVGGGGENCRWWAKSPRWPGRAIRGRM